MFECFCPPYYTHTRNNRGMLYFGLLIDSFDIFEYFFLSLFLIDPTID